MIKCPPTNSGSALQVIKPSTAVAGSPMAISGVSAISGGVIGSTAVYLFANTQCHILFEQTGAGVATTSDPPIPPGIPIIFVTTQCGTLHFVLI